MPELPDITIYIEALEQRILNQRLERVYLNSPFLLRTATPPVSAVEGKKVLALRRLGKRICIGIEDDLWLVLHLMIAGRLHWKDEVQPSGKVPAKPSRSKNHLAAFQFDNGLLALTEAGTQRRASLHIVAGEAGLQALNPGGVELFSYQKPNSEGGQLRFIDPATFSEVLRSENHTLKRALTDPHLFR